MIHFSDTIALAAEPAAIAARLMATADELTHLQEAQPLLLVLFSQRTIVFRGGTCAAVIIMPRWQGPLGMVAECLLAEFGRPVLDGHDPEFVILVDQSIWSGLDAERRERLIFHELSHLQPIENEWGVIRRSKETGKPLLKLVPHDAELFHSEIVRYGVDVCNAVPLAVAISDGEANKRRRKLRIA